MEFGAYLLSIRAGIQELGENDLLNKKRLFCHMRQGLRPEVRAALYLNPDVLKDWPNFLAAIARAESHSGSGHSHLTVTPGAGRGVGMG